MLVTKLGSDVDALMDPAAVARIGFDAVLEGEADVVAGLKNNLSVAMSRVLHRGYPPRRGGERAGRLRRFHPLLPVEIGRCGKGHEIFNSEEEDCRKMVLTPRIGNATVYTTMQQQRQFSGALPDSGTEVSASKAAPQETLNLYNFIQKQNAEMSYLQLDLLLPIKEK